MSLVVLDKTTPLTESSWRQQIGLEFCTCVLRTYLIPSSSSWPLRLLACDNGPLIRILNNMQRSTNADSDKPQDKFINYVTKLSAEAGVCVLIDITWKIYKLRHKNYHN
jgi:hypothetical protein